MVRIGAVVLGVLALAVTAGCTIARTGPATDVGPGSATLRGRIQVVNPTSAVWWFEYGTDALDGRTPQQAAGSGFDGEVSDAVTDLEPATTYGYRLCAQDSRGQYCSERLEVTTLPAPPAGTLVVRADEGLDPDGDVVEVRGAGWPARATIEVSQVVVGDPRAPGRHVLPGTVTVTAGARGRFTATLPVARSVDGGLGAPGRPGACRAPYCAVEARVVGGWPRAHAPLRFAAPAADLQVVHTDAPDPGNLGGSVTYTVVVSNVGPDAAVDAVLDTRVEGIVPVVLQSAFATTGSCAEGGPRNGLVSCDLGTLAPNEQSTVQITVQPNEDGALRHLATASSTADEGGTPADNVDALQITSIVGATPG